MPNDIHFFISTLPLLKKGQKPILTYLQFTQECERNLCAKDARHIAGISLDPGTGASPSLPTVVQWYQFETFLRNATAEARAAKLHQNPPAPRQTPMISQFTLKLVSDAFAKSNPAEREAMLDDARWNALDDLDAQHQFDLDAVAVYALKLQLLERQQSRQFEPGLQRFQDMVKEAMVQANAHRTEA